MLMIAERTKDGLINSEKREMIEKLDEELTKVIEDFERAVNVESLRLVKETGKHSLLQSGDGSPSVLSCRAKPITLAACTHRSRL